MTYQLPKIISFDELLELDIPKPRPLIAPWFNRGESCLLWAATGLGKSMIAQTLALMAAGGGRALGWECIEPTRVLYIDGEQGVSDIRERFQGLRSAVEGISASLSLEVMSRTQQAEPTSFFDVADRTHHQPFLSHVRRSKVGLVILDNFSTLTDQLTGENDAEEMKPFQSLLIALKAAGVSVLVVHHSGKSGERFRGSSNLATTFERVIALRKPRGALAGFGIDVRIRFEKYRAALPKQFKPDTRLRLHSTTTNGVESLAWVVGEDKPMPEFSRESSFLEQAWALYSTGGFPTQAAFVRALNTKFSTSYSPDNFKRDFHLKWRDKLGKSDGEIRSLIPSKRTDALALAS